MGVADTLAHATFRGIDSWRPTSPFAKQIAAMPHALVPSLDDRASSITVVGVAASRFTAVHALAS